MAALVKSVIFSSLLIIGARAQFQCQGVGFYPHPSDCTQFYRCTDLWSNGVYQQYMFTCAEGTVFDASISVCNWPFLVPSCGGAAPTPAPATEAPVTPGVTTAETTPETSVTYRPEAGSVYQCQVPGINSDQNNCNKFWLCKENPEGSGILQSLLYRCPEGYLFSSSTLRCKKEEDVSCVESVETRNIATIQLTVDMLEQFFNKWSRV